jgi:hypothetical protein
MVAFRILELLCSIVWSMQCSPSGILFGILQKSPSPYARRTASWGWCSSLSIGSVLVPVELCRSSSNDYIDLSTVIPCFG